MRKLRLILAIVITTLLLNAGNINAQESQVVIIKMYEQDKIYKPKTNSSKIYVTDPFGKIQNIEIEGYSFVGEEVENNTSKLHDEITKWQKEGFILKDFSLTFSPSPIVRITIVVLTK
ncbi:MAG TPA: hypothetical protein PLP27_12475 [Crocinitomicaceae bacterium]|nr:hypothetical protein [Crocinitomicaceae bacterium]